MTLEFEEVIIKEGNINLQRDETIGMRLSL